MNWIQHLISRMRNRSRHTRAEGRLERRRAARCASQWAGMQALEPRVLMSAGMVEFRSIDGTGNNLSNTEWGSTGEVQITLAGTDYGDGISTPAGEDLPSAREVSNAIAAGSDDLTNDRGLSAFIYAWGQFIDHDIVLTLTPTEDKESFDIAVPTGDPYFDPDGTGDQVIPFTRSDYDPDTGTDVDNPRAQTTEITAWLDGSMVYGSDETTAASLRAFTGGLMKMGDDGLLPVDEAGFFMAGDIRANENVELTSMQTLFVREHNRIATEIAARDFAGQDLSDAEVDEAIYQRARAIVGAEIQAITYNEFLPALLGANAISPYEGYDASVDPSISIEFSTAGYRLGHSMINDDVEFFGNNGLAVHDGVTLAEAFFNPDLLRETGADPILKYLASTQSQELDAVVVSSLRNFLFGQPGQGGLDLASLNIQRGRDHGLADYNTVREAYGLERVTDFDQITSDPVLQDQLRDTYGDVDSIDAWVGALAEDHVAGSSVGQLVQAIVVDQFERLRDGDRFFYQNVFTGQQLDRIEHTTLADVIKRNTNVTNLQRNVFFMQSSIAGTVFVDSNTAGGHTHQQRGPGAPGTRGIPGGTVELLNEDGDVIAETMTDRQGRYRFDQMTETGEYQVRVTLPDNMSAAHGLTREVLVSRGDQHIRGIDIALRPIAGTRPPAPQQMLDLLGQNNEPAPTQPPPTQPAPTQATQPAPTKPVRSPQPLPEAVANVGALPEALPGAGQRPDALPATPPGAGSLPGALPGGDQQRVTPMAPPPPVIANVPPPNANMPRG